MRLPGLAEEQDNMSSVMQSSYKGESLDNTVRAMGKSTGQGKTARESQDRVLARDFDAWKANLGTTYATYQPSPEQIQTTLKSVQRGRNLTRQEQEERWRNWHKHQQHKKSGNMSDISQSDATTLSTMPAGMRMGKNLTDGPWGEHQKQTRINKDSAGSGSDIASVLQHSLLQQ